MSAETCGGGEWQPTTDLEVAGMLHMHRITSYANVRISASQEGLAATPLQVATHIWRSFPYFTL